MRKSDVQTHYEYGRSRPAVNVKHSLYLPDLFRQFEATTARNRRGETYHVHEYGDDAGFWAWLHEIDDASDYAALDPADEYAREHCWEMAQKYADEIWDHLPYRFGNGQEGTHPVKVWSEGRQGGWCVVDGLPPIEDWDAIDLARWAKFQRLVLHLTHEEYPYQFIWHLAVNVWESTILPERQSAYPVPAYT